MKLEVGDVEIGYDRAGSWSSTAVSPTGGPSCLPNSHFKGR
ncbi:MAG: hypothetical protein WD646_08360 [Actinomycetota bacterium]